jgi:hypothetical protein
MKLGCQTSAELVETGDAAIHLALHEAGLGKKGTAAALAAIESNAEDSIAAPAKIAFQ